MERYNTSSAYFCGGRTGTQNGVVVNAAFGGTGNAKYFDFERDMQNNVITMGSTILAGQSRTEVTMEVSGYLLDRYIYI